jgi:hypothetical protein
MDERENARYGERNADDISGDIVNLPACLPAFLIVRMPKAA